MDLNKALPREPMTKVYVCSPFRPVSKDPQKAEEEKRENIAFARRACNLLMRYSYLPIAPHLYFPQFLCDEIEEQRELGMLLGRELLCGCDELWVFGERISEGMEAEIRQAKTSDIPVCYFKKPDDLILAMLKVSKEIVKGAPAVTPFNIFAYVPEIQLRTELDKESICEVLDSLMVAIGKEALHGK